MRSFVRFRILALVALVISGLGFAQAQTPPATKGAKAPEPGKAATPPLDLKEVLATVNNEPITKGELINFFNRYPMPPGDPNQVYRDAIDSLINTHLIFQFLERKKVPVDQKKIDDLIAKADTELKKGGGSLAAAMMQQGTSMEQVRKEYAEVVRWVDYLDKKATDPELQKFFDGHRDYFNNTQVHVSHIMLAFDPKASPEDKAKVLAKLKGIKDDIDKKKITFSEAANKFSDDKTNPDGTGGDIGFISRSTGIVPEFSDVAFKAKTGVISEPFETPYGYHIILVTERKDGPRVDMEQIKPTVKQTFGLELQKSILTAERATAKIDIKPMPAGLFGPPSDAPATTEPAKKTAAPK